MRNVVSLEKPAIFVLALISIVIAPLNALSAGQFVDTQQGAVIDVTTGLMWQSSLSSAMTRQEAVNYCDELVLAEETDWRLPRAKELQSLFTFQREPGKQLLDTRFFSSTFRNTAYWSISERDEGEFYIVFFSSGGLQVGRGVHPARCVRTIAREM